MDHNSTSSEKIIRNARTICHEISHMWFGNLVTMDWWTHIWLNEGFARFAEFLALDSIHPEYHIWDQFMKEVLIYGLREDKGSRSHPIEVTCNHPDEIEDIFDAIAYAKGASMIRMMNATLGHDTFKNAIEIYLKENIFKNTSTSDLWEVFDRISDNHLFTQMMDQWTKREGFPVIDVEIDQEQQKWILSQRS
jgi:puromycin-sensitive aminopeptidase